MLLLLLLLPFDDIQVAHNEDEESWFVVAVAALAIADSSKNANTDNSLSDKEAVDRNDIDRSRLFKQGGRTKRGLDERTGTLGTTTSLVLLPPPEGVVDAVAVLVKGAFCCGDSFCCGGRG
jgi:hypothetical protein